MNLLRKFLPHLLAIAAFVILSALYFKPVMFEGKGLYQSDAVSALGWGKDLKDYHDATGEYAHWSNAMFSGMPANYTYMPQAPNIFRSLEHVVSLDMPLGTAGLLFLYLIGFYILFVALGCRTWLSAVGAVAFAFCSYNLIIVEAGHVNKGLVMATMAPIVGGVMLCYRKKYLWGALITLVFAGLNIYWNHQQISYYLLLVLLILAIVYLIYAIKEHTLADFFKSTGVLAAVALLALLPAAGQLLPSMDYAKETMRGGAVLQSRSEGAKESSGLDIDYAYQWSYGVGESMTLLVPNMYGAASNYNLGSDSKTYEALRSTGQAAQFVKNAPTYWGPQPFTSGPVYVGAIVCLLFLFGMVTLRGRDRWWLLAATLLSLMLSWGKNFSALNDWLFYHLPLYNKFRAPSMALVIASLTMVMGGVLALKEMMQAQSRGDDMGRYRRALLVSGGFIGGICLFLALFGGSLFSFQAASDAGYPQFLVDALRADRAAMLTGDAWRSLLFVALAFAAMCLYLSRKVGQHLFVAMLGLFILVDLWQVDMRFLSWDKFVGKKQSTEIAATAADRDILRDSDPNYRVLNLTTSTFNDSKTSYYHKSVGGYSPAKLRRYQDIIDYYFSRELNMNVLNMLNTKYVIVRGPEGKPQAQLNPGALGNAWFVKEIKWVESPNEEIEALAQIDPAATAVLHREWSDKATPVANSDSAAVIRFEKYNSPGELLYTTRSSAPGLAVFSEVHYKTWRAYIDGEEAPVLRVDYILRGLQIPAGEHTVEFKCVDEVILSSAKISLFGSVAVGVVIAGIVVVLLWRELGRRKREEAAA